MTLKNLPVASSGAHKFLCSLSRHGGKWVYLLDGGDVGSVVGEGVGEGVGEEGVEGEDVTNPVLCAPSLDNGGVGKGWLLEEVCGDGETVEVAMEKIANVIYTLNFSEWKLSIFLWYILTNFWGVYILLILKIELWLWKWNMQ